MLKGSIKIYCLVVIFNIYSVNPPFLAPNPHAEQLLKTLTLRQKIGQLFMVAAASNFDQPTESLASALSKCPYNMDPGHLKNLIKNYHIGGLIFLFKSDPATQRSYIEMYQKEAQIPLLIGQDLEWGLTMRLDMAPEKVVRYPRAMTLGALSKENEHLIYDMGKEIGLQCAQVGVHMNFAPVTDVNNNPNNPVIHDRSLGDNPEMVGRRASLYARGLQDAGIIACAKHFPGHGDTDIDSHFDLPLIKHTRDRLNVVELPPFKTLIDTGVGAVMSAHLSIPALDATPNLPSSMSYKIVTNELKEQLSFQGLVITDGLGMEAITKHYEPGNLELQAFLAGNDILLCPLDVPKAVDLIEHAIQNGNICQQDLDQCVLKILKAKEWAFAQHKQHISNRPDQYLIRPEALDLQNTLYRNAVTIARDNLEKPFHASLLKESCVLQIGGQLNSHIQESAGSICHTTAGMTDYEMAQCLNAASNKDTAVILINGMNKSAQKDFGISVNTTALIKQLNNEGKKIITALFGTPYSINLVKDADTVIVAYEEVPNMQRAVIDVLEGKLLAQGRLPVCVQPSKQEKL